MSIMMFKKSYSQSSVLNQRKGGMHPAPDVDFDAATVSASGKKSPPATFDVSSDEVLADLQAEGLVRSPTLVDYKHEDQYGFLPAHAPLQTSFVGMDHHLPDHHLHHHHHHLHHDPAVDGTFEITSLQLPHLHDYHQEDHQHTHYHPEFVTAAGPPFATGISLNLEHDHTHSLLHMNPVLRSSHPHLHHTTLGESHANQSPAQPQLSSLISSVPRRLFHTLGRNPSSNNKSNRVSTIDRSSVFRDSGSPFLNESTPPRVLTFDDEKQYF